MPRLKYRRATQSPFRAYAALAAALSIGFLGGTFANARAPAAEVHKLFSTSETIVGESIAYPTQTPAQLTAAVVTLQPGGETGWHHHGVPVFGYVLEGELTVDYGDKGQRVYRTGEGFAEAIHVLHNGRNTGNGKMRVLALFMAAEGLPTTIPAKN